MLLEGLAIKVRKQSIQIQISHQAQDSLFAKLINLKQLIGKN
jgi:hypothetical protein